ncbi:tRNA pseudouridine(55) synthase TruB [Jiulongibacter sediminis]|uniref:tRNA pseudouridine synthase B n=1 Tax=Jiulongibacter sediminis TaxID=1605367 RepID=A0A0P7C6A6_9BACT|nr:tRNA pseudouridine(55) synthase TruB [Jiulongibacter sediminis]KPM49831.1 pseudouridine synthase [Jiulongibacter sediminis]TBX26867.1 pseudouridine synthase [Jiulongibacter sediminis]
MDYFDEQGCVILVDKPLEWTSFDVVNKIRYSGKFKKVGHAGTLDPLATGLLILCAGKKTKQIDTFQAQEKEYTGKLVLGKTTPSVDLETEFDGEFPVEHISEEDLESARQSFTGFIEQTPPVHSAVKVKGKRAYEAARKGEEIKLKSRTVEIKEFDIDTSNFPEVSFRVVCSKGTYIRSLVSDFGKALKSGAYMSELRRTRIGEFSVDDAEGVIELADKIKELRESL